MSTVTGIVKFADNLRRVGVPVSTSEVIDACQALEAIDISNRAIVKSALLACLIKNAQYSVIFDIYFETSFKSDSPKVQGADMEDLFREGLAGDDAALGVAIRSAVAEHGGFNDGRFLGSEYHASRVMRRLQASGALAIGENASESEVSAQLKRVRLEVEREVLRHANDDDLQREAQQSANDKTDFLRITNDEVRDLRTQVRLIGKRLATRLRIKHSRGRRGKLNSRQTVRRSLAAGGVPFDVVFRKPHPQRPDVVVLADVSGSVSGFARFTLQLVHALSAQLGNIRTFVFVDELDEVTSYFRRGDDFRSVIKHVDKRAHTLGNAGHSDYGAVFDLFIQRHLRTLRPTTTLLILGDARNNYHPVSSEALKKIRTKTRKIYWLNPEPAAHWNTADSVLQNYEPYCDAVFECRNLDQLARAIEKL